MSGIILEIGIEMKCPDKIGALMKLLTVLIAFGLLSACSATTSTASVRVAYLAQEGAQLSQSELDKYPEILVTNSFEKFKEAATYRIALWIDRNATQLVEEGWLDTMPQASYPIIVVGSNDTLLSFKYKLGICCFLGPAMPDFSDAEPGFSVIKRDSREPGAPITILQGFKQTSTVGDILKISNDILDGKVKPTTMLSSNIPMPALTAIALP
jgi:hypothetical protein